LTAKVKEPAEAQPQRSTTGTSHTSPNRNILIQTWKKLWHRYLSSILFAHRGRTWYFQRREKSSLFSM